MATGITPSASSVSIKVEKGLPKSVQLSAKAKRIAGEYLDLCKRYSSGASDPDLVECLAFSEREVKLLDTLSSDEKRAYAIFYETLVSNQRLPQKCNTQRFQNNALSKFNTSVPVPGDGNCGLHAFAVSLVDAMDARGAKKLQEVIEKYDTGASVEKTIVLDRLKRSAHEQSDREFMNALAKVLRKIGHKAIPEYYSKQIEEMGDSAEVRAMMADLIPEKDGEWVDHEGLIALGRILGVGVCVVRHMKGALVLTGDKENPGIVIDHNVDHFTPRLKK